MITSRLDRGSRLGCSRLAMSSHLQYTTVRYARSIIELWVSHVLCPVMYTLCLNNTEKCPGTFLLRHSVCTSYHFKHDHLWSNNALGRQWRHGNANLTAKTTTELSVFQPNIFLVNTTFYLKTNPLLTIRRWCGGHLPNVGEICWQLRLVSGNKEVEQTKNMYNGHTAILAVWRGNPPRSFQQTQSDRGLITQYNITNY